MTIVAEDNPTLVAVNPRRWIEQTDYLELEFAPSFRSFDQQRAELLAVLEALPPEGWSRTANVRVWGQVLKRTVLFYAQWVARHERSHYKQFERIVNVVRVAASGPDEWLGRLPSSVRSPATRRPGSRRSAGWWPSVVLPRGIRHETALPLRDRHGEHGIGVADDRPQRKLDRLQEHPRLPVRHLHPMGESIGVRMWPYSHPGLIRLLSHRYRLSCRASPVCWYQRQPRSHR